MSTRYVIIALFFAVVIVPRGSSWLCIIVPAVYNRGKKEGEMEMEIVASLHLSSR